MPVRAGAAPNLGCDRPVRAAAEANQGCELENWASAEANQGCASPVRAGAAPNLGGNRPVRAGAGARTWWFRCCPKRPCWQWTLSLPHSIRLLVIRNPPLLSRVVQLFLRAVFADQRRRARRQGIRKPLTGAVTLLQFWGSVLQLTPHAHSWLLDGVFEANIIVSNR